jgi:hypothetical protein
VLVWSGQALLQVRVPEWGFTAFKDSACLSADRYMCTGETGGGVSGTLMTVLIN